ncbi:MAG: PD-(D/E)XK nuclease family protein [Acidimicrobiales bacterium]
MADPAENSGLTPDQQTVVGHTGGPLLVRGPARSGRTTALFARWRRLVADGHDPAELLVVCQDAATARLARAALLAAHDRPAAVLSVTSPTGLAYDLLSRTDLNPVIMQPGQQRARVREALRSLSAEQLNGLSPAGITDAVVEEVRVLASVASPTDLAAAVERAASTAVGPRWAAAAAAISIYRHDLADHDLFDRATFLDQAANLAATETRFAALLVDDIHLSTSRWGSAGQLVDAMASATADAVITAGCLGPVPETFASSPRIDLSQEAGPSIKRAVSCHHRAIEGESTARIIIDALAEGRDPDDIAVICRDPQTVAIVTRSLTRHGVPVAAPPPPPGTDPFVLGAEAMLRWANGDDDDAALRSLLASPAAGIDPRQIHAIAASNSDRGMPTLEGHPGLDGLRAVRDELSTLAATANVAVIAHRAVMMLGRSLVPAPSDPGNWARERSLDAAGAWIDHLNSLVEADPGLTLARHINEAGPLAADPTPLPTTRRHPPAGVVTVCTPTDTRGHSWPLVIVCGAVEGRFPHVRAGARYLDHALLDPAPQPTAAERRSDALNLERNLFDDLVRRASDSIVAVAPLEPGVLLSRFVNKWDSRSPELPIVEPLDLAPLAPTTNNLPVFESRSLSLSASQLSTFADCSLRYLYQYPLRVRGDANIWASFGTLVHDVLEEFIGNDADATDLSVERLLRIADERWDDGLAEYRPQRDELRRDLYQVLTDWHEDEGSQIGTTLHVLRAEHAFDIAVGDHRIRGRIDRIDRADDGHGVRVLDYKTSKNPSSAAEVEDDLQLATYHLAATRDPAITALGPPTELRLLYIRNMTVRDQPVTPDHEATTEARIVAMAEEILEENFEPRIGADCKHCDVHRLCPIWPEGREVGA